MGHENVNKQWVASQITGTSLRKTHVQRRLRRRMGLSERVRDKGDGLMD